MIERVKEKLQGKKVLFISAKFYHYGDAVYEKIRSYGAEVAFYYERNTTVKHALIANFFPQKMDEWIEAHYKKILREIEGQKFDYFIVIRGHKMPLWFIETIKKANPDIYTIMYQWDSYLLYNADYRHLIPYFNRTLSFDYKDAAALNIPYAPTFHMDEYASIEDGPKSLDFIFCTNFTDEKYEFAQKFMTLSRQKSYTAYMHLYISWFNYLKQRLKGIHLDRTIISFKRLDRKAYFELFSKSRTVVDFAGTSQTGLTMRVIDALGSGKRVLTNNAYASNEPGFNPGQIVIYNAKELSLPDNVTDDETFDKKDYSIDKWLDNLFFAN
jgi:hypothetical protein